MVLPQTQDGMSFSDVNFEYQIEGDVAPTDASGHITAIEASGYELQVGEAYTGNGETAILTAGKHSPAEINAKVIFTSPVGDVWKKLWDAKTAKKKVKFIWYPAGNVSGQPCMTSDYGYLTSVTAPSGEASSADPVLAEAVLRSPKVVPSLVP